MSLSEGYGHGLRQRVPSLFFDFSLPLSFALHAREQKDTPCAHSIFK